MVCRQEKCLVEWQSEILEPGHPRALVCDKALLHSPRLEAMVY
jgi:hypothetical protein